MSTYDVRIDKHERMRLTEQEFRDLETAIDLYKKNGFRDGESRFGCVRVIECGNTQFPDLPIVDMIERGWLPGVIDVHDPELMSALCRFFRVDTVSELGVLLASPKPEQPTLATEPTTGG